MNMRILCAAALLAALPSGLNAQTLVEEVPPAELTAKVAEANAALDAGGAGPFKAEMVADPSLPTHTLYRPRNLAAAAKRGKLPILVWGNGACVNIGNRFRYFLTEVASNGYLVLAIGPAGPRTAEWKVDITPDTGEPRRARVARSFSAQMGDAIDWAIAENGRKGSAYYHRLDVNAVAVAGQSCGGLQAISAAADRRVKTLLVLNSGTFPEGTPPISGTGDAIKASLRRIHGPVLWMSGDPSDTAHVNANADFEVFTNAPAIRAWHAGTGHSVHWREPRGGLMTQPVIDWLDWQLKGSIAARATFVGAGCKLCREPGWTVRAKGF
jgi:dienelactone hydrolase